MIETLIESSIRNRYLVMLLAAALTAWAVYAVLDTPVDAIPDLSENQVIVFTDWMGRSPREIEDQVSYPLSLKLQGLSGVKTIRSSSEFTSRGSRALHIGGLITDEPGAWQVQLQLLGRFEDHLSAVHLFHFEDGEMRHVGPRLVEIQHFGIEPVVQLAHAIGGVRHADKHRCRDRDERLHVAHGHFKGLDATADLLD